MNGTSIKKIIKAPILALLLFLSAAGTYIRAVESPLLSGPGQFILSPDSKLWLEGNSTLHLYSSTAKVLSATILAPSLDFKGPAKEFFYNNALNKNIEQLKLEIPVSSMESGKSKLDQNMRDALLAKQHPKIVYELENYSVFKSTVPAADFAVQTQGTLEVAGKKKKVGMTILGVSTDYGAKLKGQKELLMTDFGVQPPEMFLGTLKTHNKIVIHFELSIKLKSELLEKGRPLGEPRL